MRRTLSLLLCFVLLLTLGTLSATASPISPVPMSITASTWSELQTAVTAGESLILIDGDITATGTLTIANGHDITITSADENNIHTITSAPGARHFQIANSGGILRLEHIVLDGGGVSGGVNIGPGPAERHLFLEEGSVIQNCITTGSGGAVNAIQPNSAVTINGGTIQHNEAGTLGGGVHVGTNSSLTINSGLIYDNHAGTSGGGISVSGSAFLMTGGTIRYNTALNGAGASIQNSPNAQMQYGFIFDNVAEQNGGGVHVFGGTIFTMSGGTISTNEALNGAGVNVLGGNTTPVATFVLQDDGLIEENIATQDGGGVHTQNGIIEIEGGEITANEAVRGGGVFLQGSRSSSMSGGSITANIATNNGGGIGIFAPAAATVQLNMSGGTIDGNTAANNGGGIWIANGTATTGARLNMTAGAITGNTAISGDGGGIFTANHNYVDPVPFDTAYTNITITNASISGNTAGGGQFMPPSNASESPFGDLLTNYEINFHGIPAAQVTFILNGGNVDGDTADIVHLLPLDEAIGTANVPVPTRNNYTFDGWQRLDDYGYPVGSVLTREQVAALTLDESMTFEARWTPTTPGNGNGNGNGGNPFSPYHNAFLIGRPDGNIYPHDNITRAEVAAVFFRLLSDETRIAEWSQTNPFPDVRSGHWFNNVVSTVANMGVIYGMPDGTFAPDRPITRAEVAAIVARFFDESGTSGVNFSDITGHWGEDYIRQLSHLGWVQGYLDGTFRPNAPITRAEFTAIINRMLDRVPDSLDALLDGRILWPDKRDTNAWYYLYMQEASHSTEFTRLPNGNLRWTRILEHLEWEIFNSPDARPDDLMVSRR